MKRLLLLVVIALSVMAPAAMAGAVEIADLVADSAAYDSALVGEITVEGEMVGDFQRRGDVVWVQVNGDAYMYRPTLEGGEAAGSNTGVGVRIPTVVFEGLGVSEPGGYRVRGAIVRLTGDWRHHDPDRAGESYLDVRAAEVLEPERRLSEPVQGWPFVLGAALTAVAGVAVFALRRRL